MKKSNIFIIFCLLAAASVSAAEIKPFAVPASRQYVLVINGYDWGAAADKVIMNAGKKIAADAVSASDFTADIVVNTSQDGNGFGIVKGKRRITDAYTCSSAGVKTTDKSQYIALELAVSPDDSSCSPFFSLPIITNLNQIYGLRIKNEKLGLQISNRTGIESPLAGQFNADVFSEEDITLHYVSWEPPKHSGKTPLVIWLHGISAGGTDPYVALFESKAVTFITDKFQSNFAGGACVLVPQCPTGWLETTTKDAFGKRMWEPVDISGSVEKITKPVENFMNKFLSVPESRQETTPSAAVSYYTLTLKNLIDNYIASHPYIDSDRIYIGGFSAGGYMTLNMCLQYPDFFAAAFTASEAHLDSKISDGQIKQLAKLPLWFVYADNDTVMKPASHAKATIERLRNAGASNLHVSEFADVHDTTGQYRNPVPSDDDDAPKTYSEEPYQYSGHEAVIYLFNEKCSDSGVTLFKWLSEQSR